MSIARVWHRSTVGSICNLIRCRGIEHQKRDVPLFRIPLSPQSTSVPLARRELGSGQIGKQAHVGHLICIVRFAVIRPPNQM